MAGLICLGADAAKKKTITFTKKYDNQRLEIVLRDFCREAHLTLDYVPGEIDMSRPISANFKDASTRTVMRQLLAEDEEYKVKKGVLLISKKATPPRQEQREAITPSKVEETATEVITTYMDTTFTIREQLVVKENRQKKDSPQEPASDEVKGHYLQVLLGGGFGGVLGSKLTDTYDAANNSRIGSFSGNLRLQYAYYFNDNWGIAAGLGFSGYASYIELNTLKSWSSYPDGSALYDSEREQYDRHDTYVRGWKERTATYMLDIPISAQYRYPINDKVSLFAAVGLKLGLPIVSQYKVRGGEIEHQGYYSRWNMTLSQTGAFDYYTETAERDFARLGNQQTYSLKMPSVAPMLDLGVLLPVARGIDVVVGAYFHYTANSIKPSEVALGWQQPEAATHSGMANPTYRRHEFMNEYAGVASSEYAKAVRPWSAGITVGISWHPVPPQPPVSAWERILVRDTTITLSERVVREAKPAPEQIANIEELQQELSKSVIWFQVNSTTPMLRPADILEKVADYLKSHPEQRLYINGHASREGNEQHNQRLSDRRAEAVAKILIRHGVSEQQLLLKGYSSQVSYEGNADQLELDRRVELIPIHE